MMKKALITGTEMNVKSKFGYFGHASIMKSFEFSLCLTSVFNAALASKSMVEYDFQMVFIL